MWIAIKYGINYLFLMVVLSLLHGCNKNESKTDTGIGKPPDPPNPEQIYYRGVDLSYQPEIEEYQIEYLDEEGKTIDMLPFLESRGVNLVRLRLWHTPETIHSSLEEVLAYAIRAKQAGMDILLNFHYSDTWADPAKQFVPQAWTNLTFEQLNDSIYQYSYNVIQKFKEKSVLPVIVQVGNETNAGFLWDYGRVGGTFNDNWPNYITLVKSAIQAIKDVDQQGEIEIMIHFAGFSGAEWYFDYFSQYNVDYDIIGLSYYSVWHGTNFEEVKDQIKSISQKYPKDIMIVETGYPWTLNWNDWTHNFWGEEGQLIPDYPATPAGQKDMLEALNTYIKSLSNDKGIGFCYWAPDCVAYKGNEATDGSAWENVTVFDFNNKILPVISVFEND